MERAAELDVGTILNGPGGGRILGRFRFVVTLQYGLALLAQFVDACDAVPFVENLADLVPLLLGLVVLFLVDHLLYAPGRIQYPANRVSFFALLLFSTFTCFSH